MGATFDQWDFVHSLDWVRRERGLSWRQVALQTELEPSTVLRIVGGSMPDLPRFVVLVEWMGRSADSFINRSGVEIEPSSPQRVLDSGFFRGDDLSPAQLEHVRSGLEEIYRGLTA